MPKLTDSCADIIKTIPAHWHLKRLKYLCTIETGDQDTQDADPNGEYPFYVRSPIIEKSTRFSFDGEGILMAGDGAAGRIFHHAFGKYAVHQRVYRLANFKNINSQYLFYYLSNIFAESMNKGSAQTTVPSVRLPMLTNFDVCIPPFREQEVISTYLNYKCSEIDTLSAEIEKQIETLEQYKRSIIIETVTKGLDPNTEMKDSGIKWIGLYPNTWNLKKIKYCLQERIEKNNPIKTSDILSLTAKKGVIPYDQKEGGGNKPKEDIRAYHLAYPGDIVMNSMNILSGAVGLSAYYGCVSPVYYMLRPIDKTDDVRFYNYIFQTTVFQRSLYGLGNGILVKESENGNLNTIRLRIPMSKFGQLFIPVAPSTEQRIISDYLDVKCNKINSVIEDKKIQLETLANYKKSLIYEYVTGKKEVPVQ